MDRANEVAAHLDEWATTQGITTAGTTRTAVPDGVPDGVPQPQAQPQPPKICHVLASLTEPWPALYQPPTIVISCVPATAIDSNPPADFEMPSEWLRSPTGGVVVEVGNLSSPHYLFLHVLFPVSPYLKCCRLPIQCMQNI